MTDYYPIAIRLKNKRAVIAGGGTVAERKVISLLQAQAAVEVVSPALTKTIKALAASGRIKWTKRRIRQDDIKGAAIVIAATSDRTVNEKISVWAKRLGIPANAVDDKASSDFISPAVFKKEKAIITVYTDGKDPELSRDLKNFLKERWGEFNRTRIRAQKEKGRYPGI